LIDKFFALYDANKRAVRFFVIIKGQTYPTVCLTWFIDKGIEGWVKHEFELNQFCAGIVRVTENTWEVYTGGETGRIYKLESNILRDNGTIYESSISTIPQTLDNQRNTKRFDRIWTVMQPKGTEGLAMDVSIDNRPLDTQYLIMTGADTILHNFYIDVGAMGQREQITYTSIDGNDYFLSEVFIDFKDTGSI